MIARPRLTEAVVGCRAALILFAAPPGFGKTTLLAQWRELDERPFAWLSTDESDNDPTVFWAGIIAAVKRVRPGFGHAAEIALRAAHVDVVDALVPLILHELEASDEELVLLLDDYQAVVNPSCHHSLAFFMDAKPDNVQLVLSGREDPAIPIAKLRAAGRLLELRAVDLCFTLEEEAAFLNQGLGLSLEAETLDVLHGRTEGWPAGVYLASLSLRNAPDPVEFVSSFGGSNRHVVDYLTEVVLDLLDAEQRSFLLETSILESFSAPLCDAVTQRGDSAEQLGELERVNLFLIPLDDRRERYRYHQLFAELLRGQLLLREPELAPELHRRAHDWLEAAGDLGGAVRHALAAGEVGAAAELVARRWMSSPYAHFGRPEVVLRNLEDFPAEARQGDAGLALVSAWAESMLHRRDEADEALSVTDRAESGSVLADGTSVGEAAALVRACFSWGDVGRFRASAEALCELEFTAFWQPVALHAVGLARYLSGDLSEAKEPLEQSAAAAQRVEQWLVASAAQALLARISLAEGELEEADTLAHDALELLESRNLTDQPGAGIPHVALGAVLARQGHVDDAGVLLVRGLAQLRLRGDAFEIADALLVYAPVRRALETLASARALIEEARVLLSGCADPGMLAQKVEDVARALTPGHRRIEGDSELTERELEVLRYLADGLPKRDIGRILFLSYNTIHSHTKSIYQKLRVSSRQAAVDRARDLGAL
jgi:LuxR family maltose regulon positive regulatory protein